MRANSTAIISGAISERLHLTDLVTVRETDPMTGEPLDTLDLILRAPDEGSVRIHGEIDRIATTGDDLEVRLMHRGVIYRTTDDECTVGLHHLGPRPDAAVSSYLVTGSITCTDLAPEHGGEPVDLRVTIHHELGGRPPGR
jgi:hypothetical protein